MKNTKTKMAKKGIAMLALAVALLFVPFAAADSFELWCVPDGELVNLKVLCNPAMDNRDGPITLCMHLLDNGKTCPTTINICNSLGLSCSIGDGNATLDVTPPVITLNSPVEGELYTARSVLVDIDLDETSDIAYQNLDNPNKWTTICTNCVGSSKSRTFEEGANHIMFRAMDKADNAAYFNVTFYVDSQDPQIGKTTPTQGFASGLFGVEFEEDNPENLTINYGNDLTGFRNYLVNLNTECTRDDSDYACSVQIDLSDFDGQQIQYYAVISDVAGNVDQSNTEEVEVDYSSPILSSVNYTIAGKYVTFLVEVSESYFDEIVYIDHSESKPKEKTLCSKLVNNVCTKKVSFTNDGEHEVEIIVRDDAGNSASRTIPGSELFTDSKEPKITDVQPDKDFASGLFEVEFEEANPVSVVLNYGNLDTGMREFIVDLADCIVNEDEYVCTADVNLADYDGEEVEYNFVVKDRVNQEDSDGADGLKVDISAPVITSLNTTVDGKYVYFTVSVDEAYLDEIVYIDYSEAKPKEKSLCTKLTNGICSKKVTFSKDGEHNVTVTVRDDAGHATAQSVELFTDSKEPKITDVQPDKDFASGMFEVEFEEANPVSIILNYGNSETGMREHEFGLASCTVDEDEYVCMEEVELSDFDGQEIEYNFVVTDRVSQTDEDGEKELIVDLTAPVVNSINYTLSGTNKAEFVLNVDEDNFDEITYINNDDSSPKERSFCTRLTSGTCKKTLTLNAGQNTIDFVVYDEAGNSVGESVVVGL